MTGAGAFAMRDLGMVVRTGQPVYFGPGCLIPAASGESYPQAVLNAIGRDVDSLEWDWPAPYDGEVRRMRRRIEGKARALEKLVDQCGVKLVNSTEVMPDPYAIEPLWHARRAFGGPR